LRRAFSLGGNGEVAGYNPAHFMDWLKTLERFFGVVAIVIHGAVVLILFGIHHPDWAAYVPQPNSWDRTDSAADGLIQLAFRETAGVGTAGCRRSLG
jgi:hypothetical protein